MTPQAPKSVYVPKAPPPVPPRPVPKAPPQAPKPVHVHTVEHVTDIPGALAHAKAVRAAQAPKAPPMDPPPKKETPNQAKARKRSERQAIKDAARKAADPEKYERDQKRKAKQKAAIERKAAKLMLKTNPYVYDKPRVLPNGMPGTLKGLAEAFFEMDLADIKEFEPRTVAEAAVRAAWLKASYGDTKAMNMLWNRIHAATGPANPLADMLAALGQAAALKPTTLSQSQPESDED